MVQPRVISRETPTSREIEGVVYLALRRDLWVYFRSGAVNIYSEVDAAMWEAFETAESKEDFIHALRSYKVLVTGKKPE
jgi:KTSC domain-containing protein